MWESSENHKEGLEELLRGKFTGEGSKEEPDEAMDELDGEIGVIIYSEASTWNIPVSCSMQ